MKKKQINLKDITKEDLDKMFNKHRVKRLAKFINKHYLKNNDFKESAGSDLHMIVSNEILKGLDEEFSILRDDPDDPNIKKLINDKTVEIIKEIYK
jgi:hypothetical protein